jgi:hypothetical protein
VNVIEFAGTRAVVLDAGEGRMADAKGIVSWLGDVMGEDAEALVVPVDALPAAFFDLRSGVAGEVLQKAANYRIVFAVVGDVGAYTSTSRAFHDLVVESGQATGYTFARDTAALEAWFTERAAR